MSIYGSLHVLSSTSGNNWYLSNHFSHHNQFAPSQNRGLTEQELVALSGAHDLGRHVTLLDMPKACLKNLTRTCLEDAPVLIPFVTADPDTLSNRYFQTLLRWNDREIEYGEALFIPTDVAMVVDE